MLGFNTRRRRRVIDIAPDEIFLDSSNLPGHFAGQLEGRVERSVTTRPLVFAGVFFCAVAILFAAQSLNLQIVHGAAYADVSRNNTLGHSLVFSTRGVIYDRMGVELAWNELASTTIVSSVGSTTSFALRRYNTRPGMAHILGWMRYPKEDASGVWWRDAYTGMSGAELSFDSVLSGVNGSTIVESDARGRIQRKNIISPAQDGENLHLSIDADVQSELYTLLWAHARENHFMGGAAVIMDVETGQMLALTSFPEYDHASFTDGDNAVVAAASVDAHTPLLNRAVAGLYAPGSIVKPIFAAAALNEKIISPDKIITSVGQISIPNAYDHTKPTIFRDWTVHGPIDMRTALAVSSDEYFYTIGGGYGGQAGLGIDRIDRYARMFGLASTTGIALLGEQDGNIPTPAWKARIFPDDAWRLGDTYHTAIGQYGFQVTPIQAVRYASAIANGGRLFTPQIIMDAIPHFTPVGIPDSYLQIVREGMRMAVTSNRSDATVKFFNISGIELAAKTGTAQIGNHNQWMNSWSIGFWPASKPRYAYAVVLEQAPAGTASGAAPAMLPFFQWLIANHPEYVHALP